MVQRRLTIPNFEGEPLTLGQYEDTSKNALTVETPGGHRIDFAEVEISDWSSTDRDTVWCWTEERDLPISFDVLPHISRRIEVECGRHGIPFVYSGDK